MSAVETVQLSAFQLNVLAENDLAIIAENLSNSERIATYPIASLTNGLGAFGVGTVATLVTSDVNFLTRLLKKYFTANIGIRQIIKRAVQEANHIVTTASVHNNDVSIAVDYLIDIIQLPHNQNFQAGNEDVKKAYFTALLNSTTIAFDLVQRHLPSVSEAIFNHTQCKYPKTGEVDNNVGMLNALTYTFEYEHVPDLFLLGEVAKIVLNDKIATNNNVVEDIFSLFMDTINSGVEDIAKSGTSWESIAGTHSRIKHAGTALEYYSNQFDCTNTVAAAKKFLVGTLLQLDGKVTDGNKLDYISAATTLAITITYLFDHALDHDKQAISDAETRFRVKLAERAKLATQHNAHVNSIITALNNYYDNASGSKDALIQVLSEKDDLLLKQYTREYIQEVDAFISSISETEFKSGATQAFKKLSTPANDTAAKFKAGYAAILEKFIADRATTVIQYLTSTRAKSLESKNGIVAAWKALDAIPNEYTVVEHIPIVDLNIAADTDYNIDWARNILEKLAANKGIGYDSIIANQATTALSRWDELDTLIETKAANFISYLSLRTPVDGLMDAKLDKEMTAVWDELEILRREYDVNIKYIPNELFSSQTADAPHNRAWARSIIDTLAATTDTGYNTLISSLANTSQREMADAITLRANAFIRYLTGTTAKAMSGKTIADTNAALDALLNIQREYGQLPTAIQIDDGQPRNRVWARSIIDILAEFDTSDADKIIAGLASIEQSKWEKK